MKTKNQLMSEILGNDPGDFDNMVFDLDELTKLPLDLHNRMLANGEFVVEYDEEEYNLLFRYYHVWGASESRRRSLEGLVRKDIFRRESAEIVRSLNGLLMHVDQLIKSNELRRTVSNINDPAAIEDISSRAFWTNQAFIGIKDSLESILEAMNNKEQ